MKSAMITAFSLMVTVAFFAPQASAFKDGTLTCQFEVIAKKNFPTVEKLAPFTIKISEPFSDAFQAPSLNNRLLLAYSPGYAAPRDVNLFNVTLKYDGANAGADVPAVANGEYTFKISRDDSDLVGAFLVCKAALN